MTRRPPAIEPADLRAVLGAVLSRHFRRDCRLDSIAIRPSPYASTCRLHELDIRLDDGRRLALMWKDLDNASTGKATRVGPHVLYDARREIHAYRTVLRHSRDGTPRFYGAVVTVRPCRRWLFVERIHGTELPQVGDFAIWEAAAAWLGRFHRQFASTRSRRGLAVARLVEYDLEFLALWLERVRRRQSTGRLQPGRDVDRMLNVYERSLPALAALPRTIIHGELFPANVIVAHGAKTSRICPVDWETIGIGPGLLDLAMLAAGSWRDDHTDRLLAVYDAACRGETRARRLPKALTRAFALCQLHVAVRMLGWPGERDWHPPRQHAHDWLHAAVTAARKLDMLHQ